MPPLSLSGCDRLVALSRDRLGEECKPGRPLLAPVGALDVAFLVGLCGGEEVTVAVCDFALTTPAWCVEWVSRPPGLVTRADGWLVWRGPSRMAVVKVLSAALVAAAGVGLTVVDPEPRSSCVRWV